MKTQIIISAGVGTKVSPGEGKAQQGGGVIISRSGGGTC